MLVALSSRVLPQSDAFSPLTRLPAPVPRRRLRRQFCGERLPAERDGGVRALRLRGAQDEERTGRKKNFFSLLFCSSRQRQTILGFECKK